MDLMNTIITFKMVLMTPAAVVLTGLYKLITSWFKHQNYTSIKVPSHREIQQALVEIGDKDPSFIGSREWIGAIELCFALDKLLGVGSKIMNVRSGAEMSGAQFAF